MLQVFVGYVFNSTQPKLWSISHKKSNTALLPVAVKESSTRPTKGMKFAVAIVALAAQAAAQTAFLASPVLLWTGNIPPVNEGNECALAPANPLLLCTSAEGLVSALPTTTTSGAAVATWVYRTDPTDGSVSSSTSGITFSSDGSSFVYSTTASDTTGSPTIWYVQVDNDTCCVSHVRILLIFQRPPSVMFTTFQYLMGLLSGCQNRLLEPALELPFSQATTHTSS